MKRFWPVFCSIILGSVLSVASGSAAGKNAPTNAKSLAINWQSLDLKDLGFSMLIPAKALFNEAPIEDMMIAKTWTNENKSQDYYVKVMVGVFTENFKPLYDHSRMLTNGATVIKEDIKDMSIPEKYISAAKDVVINGMRGREVTTVNPTQLPTRGIAFATPNASFTVICTHVKPNPAFDAKLFGSIKIASVEDNQSWGKLKSEGMSVNFPTRCQDVEFQGGLGPMRGWSASVNELNYVTAVYKFDKRQNTSEQSETLDAMVSNFLKSEFGSKEIQLLRSYEINGHPAREYLFEQKQGGKGKMVYCVTPTHVYQFHADGDGTRLQAQTKQFFESIAIDK